MIVGVFSLEQSPETHLHALIMRYARPHRSIVAPIFLIWCIFDASLVKLAAGLDEAAVCLNVAFHRQQFYQLFCNRFISLCLVLRLQPGLYHTTGLVSFYTWIVTPIQFHS